VKGYGEAEEGSGSDEAKLARHEHEDSGRKDLLDQAFARANMAMVWKQVKTNGGSAGAEGLTIGETMESLRTDWSRINEELLEGRCRPVPVRRVQIPKAGGGQKNSGYRP
jgi:RNA-directed DNA polymerase